MNRPALPARVSISIEPLDGSPGQSWNFFNAAELQFDITPHYRSSPGSSGLHSVCPPTTISHHTFSIIGKALAADETSDSFAGRVAAVSRRTRPPAKRRSK